MKKYAKFERITLYCLYHELWASALLFKPYPSEVEMTGFSGYMKQNFTGTPFLFKPEQLDYIEDGQTLPSPPHIFITDITRLVELSITARK